MHTFDESEKRESLRQLLVELSSSQDILKENKIQEGYFSKLESIYYNTGKENFRHYYSDIFACLTLIDGDTSIGSLDILAQNMQTIKDEYVPKNNDSNGELIDINKEIAKLYDHTNLDIGRINYTKRMTGEALSELSKTKIMVDDLEKNFLESKEVIRKNNEKWNAESEMLKAEIRENQKKMQSEYVTILGIFASIVLAFTGGMTFSSSVLENLDKASIYRIILVISFLGFIVFNILWMLIHFLRDINEKNGYNKLYMIAINALLILSMVLTFVAYKYHWLERETVDLANNQKIEVKIESEI